MDNRVQRIALIGCGKITDKHRAVIEKLHPQLELVAVCDIDRDKAEKTACLAKVTPYIDFRQMLREQKPDIVAILTWSGNHASLGIECLDDVPSVIIEKPMALKLSDANTLVEKAQRLQRNLFVVKQYRYHPPVQALKNAIQLGRFGKSVMGTVRVRWCRTPEYYMQDSWRGTREWDGGVLTNQASHHLDLLTWLMGPVESVFAMTGTFLAPIETEDTGVVVLRFKSGALGVVEATTCVRPVDLEGSLSILGERGAVEVAGFAVDRVRTWRFANALPEDSQWESYGQNVTAAKYPHGHEGFYRHVLNNIFQGQTGCVDGIEGRKAVELVEAIYLSAKERREVFLTETRLREGKVHTRADFPTAFPS